MPLRHLFFTLVCACSVSCGSQAATEATHAEPEEMAPRAESNATAIQSVNEWGLVSVGRTGVELAAGPGRQYPLMEELTIDKPVLYVHANARTRLHVSVQPGQGLSVAEHFPPSSDTTLAWNVEVNPGECTTPRNYSGSCNSSDGYCETRELALYETRDAACLSQGGLALPLLFYRLYADTPQVMPLQTARGENDEVTIINSGLATGAPIWRVTWDGAHTQATRISAPARGAEATIPRPSSGGVENVRRSIRTGLTDQGLTGEEASAFVRAWDSALFGAEGSVDEDGDGDGLDAPDIDRLTSDETTSAPGVPGAPRITDTILYWLPESDIERMATLVFRPEPQEVNRAILVRVDVR